MATFHMLKLFRDSINEAVFDIDHFDLLDQWDSHQKLVVNIGRYPLNLLFNFFQLFSYTLIHEKTLRCVVIVIFMKHLLKITYFEPGTINLHVNVLNTP